MKSPEERAKLKAEHEPEVELISATYFQWTWPGVGSGQMSIEMDMETGAIKVMDERIGRDDTRRILISYAKHLADIAILQGDKPPYRIDQMPLLQSKLAEGIDNGTLNIEGEKNG